MMMKLQPVCCPAHLPSLSPPASSTPPSSHSRRKSSTSSLPLVSSPAKVCWSNTWWRDRSVAFGEAGKCHGIRISPLERSPEGRNGTPYLPNPPDSDAAVAAAAQMPNSKVDRVSGSSGEIRLEPFGGKLGCVSFCGLTYHALEERKLVSSPFKEGTGSFVWVLGPLAFISSLLLPQVFLSNVIEVAVRDEIIAEILSSLFSEVIFYAGLATFLLVTDHIQGPYLQFSPKRWGLITGLRGYLSSAFFTMGFKVCAPLFAVYVVWPAIGLPALVAVAPFLLGCGAQFAFEMFLDKRGSSCWPLLPIIFEVYRLYQLSKGAHFIQGLMFSMRRSATSPEVLDRSGGGGAFVSMLFLFQVLGVVCLWSLTTFLLRLFPSRPVAEKY